MKTRGRILALSGAVGIVLAGTMGAAVAEPTVNDGGSVDGIRYLDTFAPVTASAPLTLKIPCPGTKQPTGGGFNAGSNPLDSLRGAFPADLNGDGRIDGWRVVIETGKSSFGYGSAYAICRTGSFTYVVSKGSLPADTPGGLTLTATCPSNLHITGGGAVASGGAGEHRAAEVTSSFPFDGSDTDTKPDDGWRARFFGTNQPGTKVYAICAPTNQKYVRLPSTVTTTSGGYWNLCPADRHVVGIGAKIGGPAGETRAFSVFPGDGLGGDPNDDEDTVPDDDAHTGFNNEMASPVAQTGVSWAICGR